MKDYNATEKQQIMLFSDLLNDSLTQKEIKEFLNGNLDIHNELDTNTIDKSNLDNKLKNKVSNLLDQGMKLSIELDNLSKRGIKIKFPSMNTKVNFVCSDGITEPLFCFILGNEELLSSDNIKVVSKYSDFQKNKGDQIIFTIDRNFETLLSYNDIIESLENKSILLVSNLFRNKSEIKVAVSDERSKGKVFISGSRSQDEIPNNIQMSLKAIMERNIEVLIGDSDKGVDNQIIDYFKDSYDLLKFLLLNNDQGLKSRIHGKYEQLNLINPSQQLRNK